MPCHFAFFHRLTGSTAVPVGRRSHAQHKLSALALAQALVQPATKQPMPSFQPWSDPGGQPLPCALGGDMHTPSLRPPQTKQQKPTGTEHLQGFGFVVLKHSIPAPKAVKGVWCPVQPELKHSSPATGTCVNAVQVRSAPCSLQAAVLRSILGAPGLLPSMEARLMHLDFKTGGTLIGARPQAPLACGRGRGASQLGPSCPQATCGAACH